MSKVIKVQVSKMFVADIFLVVPDEFDGNVSKYSRTIEKQANDMTPSSMHMRPWEEDKACFEIDKEFENATTSEVDNLGLEGCPEDKPDY